MRLREGKQFVPAHTASMMEPRSTLWSWHWGVSTLPSVPMLCAVADNNSSSSCHKSAVRAELGGNSTSLCRGAPVGMAGWGSRVYLPDGDPTWWLARRRWLSVPLRAPHPAACLQAPGCRLLSACAWELAQGHSATLPRVKKSRLKGRGHRPHTPLPGESEKGRRAASSDRLTCPELCQSATCGPEGRLHLSPCPSSAVTRL